MLKQSTIASLSFNSEEPQGPHSILTSCGGDPQRWSLEFRKQALSQHKTVHPRKAKWLTS